MTATPWPTPTPRWPMPAPSMPVTRPGAAAGPGLQGRAARRAGQQFLGGWRMRLQLARALMCPAELMLLDEPTNHLDLDALVWLEGLAATLRRHADRHQPRPRVPRRHHQGHPAPRRRQADAHRYGGNYTSLRGHARRAHGAAAGGLRAPAGKVAHLQKFIDRFKAKASKAKQAQSRVKALERMEKGSHPCWPRPTSVRVPRAANLPNPMLMFDELQRRLSHWHDADKIIVRGVDRSVLGRPAHRHPRRQRPGKSTFGQDHRPREPSAGWPAQPSPRAKACHRLLCPAGAGRAAPDDAGP